MDDVRPLTALTPREREIAALVAEGLLNKEIAKRLALTQGTVSNYITNSLRVLDFTNRVQLAVWAVEHGLYCPPSWRHTEPPLRRIGRAG